MAPVIRGNSLYTIVDGPSWTQAEANSVKLGGHLVTINDKEENDFIWKKLGTDHWIGLSDEKSEGTWEWTTGEQLTYQNWIQWSFNQGPSEDYAWLWGNNGQWDDNNLTGIWGGSSPNIQGIAETPFIRRGDSAYVIVQGPTWEEAEANAVKLGGHLVTINDAAENDWILSTFRKDFSNGAGFIGYSDKASEGNWVWSSGEPTSYTKWDVGNPSNSSGVENVGTIQFGDGSWNDIATNYWNWFGKQGDIKGIAEIRLAPNNNPIGTPTLSGNFKSGQVISIDRSPLQDSDNFTGYTPDYKYAFEVSNNNGTTWTKLTSTDATDNNSTYTLTTAEVGKKVRGVVSYLDGYGTNESVASAGSPVASAAVVRGNSLYTIVDGYYWHESEELSRQRGGNLVTINSSEENSFIYSSFGAFAVELAKTRNQNSSKTNLHIGLNDLAREGLWAWSSGQQVEYTNWHPGEPANGTEGNHAGIFVNWGSNGEWHDLYDSYIRGDEANIGVAETPFIRRGDSAYVIVQGPTWEEAEANAVKLGGHLVTINDAAENQWISDSFRDRLAAPDRNVNNGLRAGSWIGLNDKAVDGVPKWSDGSEVTYTNFVDARSGIGTSGVFDGWLTVMLDPNGIVQKYAGLNSWHEGPATYLPGYTVYTTGIAEIKLAPNNAPTGTPTLSGTLKAGQVISIDKTPIQDADNFTGYTPNYNYAFEVSNDNGTTWTKLTSTDATDNNNTYTLTTADAGRKVRGVLSYLDGYGTNESVASAASTKVIAPSNTAPTAVQTLTGSSKVGRVLTVDKSTIVDPDGVPTAVSYGWEVSTNGNTWTKLTSADATGNNSTYALTAAELGKTVRSVITFTDGYGANEVVRSSATIAVVAGSKPTNISLSSTNIVENIGANAAVGKLSSVDTDTDDTFKYSLVSGTGSTDNSKFSIAGDQLVITGNPDYETKNSYSIRVRTTDLAGMFVDKSFALKVTNVNEAPIAINLSDTDFVENITAGSVIGNLASVDPDRDTTFTYSLTPNSPRATFVDNQFFSIVNDQLKINASANFEQKDTYTISVRSTDAGKLFYDQLITLVVQDVDEAPTDISIIGTGIDENAAVGSIVGSLVSADQDESSTDFTYALVAGTKANNNDLFEIVGDQLKAKATFNFEIKSSYVVNVRTSDETGLTFDKSITIKVNNVNENPTDLTVSATAFNENVALGTTVATLGFVDPDKTGTYSYSLVSGVGDKDNQVFSIAANALKVNVATDYEVQKSYAVRLRVTDQGGLFFEKSVVLGVNNLVEKVTSAVSTTLAPDKDTLELTGTKNIFGTGNQFDNTISGNSGKNKLIGGMGKDILIGNAGVDTFFYNDLKESLLSGFDVITDYAAGEKIIAGFQFEGDDLIASTGKASALSGSAIGSVLTNTTFVANNAAAFTVEGLTGTFLTLNDGRDGFQADSDALIHLSNYTIGSKTPISII